MELEYKIAAIIGSCVNEGQLFTARECVRKAISRLTHDEGVYLRKLADHKETALRQQMLEFRNNAEAVATELQCTTETKLILTKHYLGLVSLEDVSVTSNNVAKVAETITVKP